MVHLVDSGKEFCFYPERDEKPLEDLEQGSSLHVYSCTRGCRVQSRREARVGKAGALGGDCKTPGEEG